KQADVAELLSGFESATVREVCAIVGVTRSVLDALTARGVTQYFDMETGRKPEILSGDASGGSYGEDASGEPHQNKIELTAAQERAYNNLCKRYRSGESTVTLLYGVTGSGKTSVFMRLIDDVLADGKSVIVMVPEIALTPQAVGRFRGRYGDLIALLHSGLSLGQRLDEWKRIKSGAARVVVGTRSAVFAPAQNLGAVIIDEEHEYTYKSESSPRYHARDVAKFRCAWHNAPLILSSATPSLESYFLATAGKKYSLETLDMRYGGARLPTVNIVDLSAQNLSESIISPVLRESLSYNLENGYQSILLHNRRGYNTFVACRACNHVLYCGNCSVSMTYHRNKSKHFDGDRLVCHHCGETRPFALECPNCGREQLRYAGLGTQRAEDELAALFPKARILRMDADSVGGRTGHAALLSAFAAGEYDIMIGTQMVAKGLDFERVTLVGVLLADQTLCADDFRSYERAFALLTQVVGRSGRGTHPGVAVIQTLSPENPLFEMAASQDYVKFYRNEIGIRQAMLNPPFSDICMVGFVGEDDEAARAMSAEFLSLLKFRAEGEFSGLPMRVLGPSPAAIRRIMGKYRYRMLIKCRNTKRMRELITILLCEIGGKREYKKVTAFADMNLDDRF
ncbi:MAG: primosomal protein N', partial [Oscillospiraceae bacterium]|nr:primosomal protein N' [Oscillospiraceae bacterium]